MLRRRARAAEAFRPAAAAAGACVAGRRDLRMAAERQEIMRIGRRLRDQGGAALIIDYGHVRSDAGDTFQAISRHSFTDPLAQSGAGRPHRACRFPGARARRRRCRRAPARSGRAGRVPATPRHRDARGDADEQGEHAGVGRYPVGAEAADRHRPRRHGRAVQGARRLASGHQDAAGPERSRRRTMRPRPEAVA